MLRISLTGSLLNALKSKRIVRTAVLLVFAACAFLQMVEAAMVSPIEMQLARQWTAAKFENASKSSPPSGILNADPFTPFFSFTYAGKPSSELLKTWKLSRASRKLDKLRTQHTLIWMDPETGLLVRCDAVEYKDFPTVEWTITFKNTGTNDTPILENIQSFDLDFQRPKSGEFLLHHFVGSLSKPNDYQPLVSTLGANSTKKISAAGGRPTNSDMSYFNLESPDGQGLIIAVGWPGQWSSEWTRDAGTGLHVNAGQELTHLKLHPGEEIRTPLMAIQFWRGPDWIRSQNIWRQWMLAHNVPKPGGKLPECELFGCSSHLYNEMCNANEANQKMCIDRYIAEKLGIGHWWMDAGWYKSDGACWWKTGTWEVDTARFPNGLRAVSDYAHSKGLKTIVWFEPERVEKDTWLSNNHPEWVLGGQNGGVLNLGNPEAREWLTEHVNNLIESQGIDLYRQDFNMDPLEFWRKNDAPDRQGITENKHVTGYLAYWDALLKKHPDMFIDTCASGGRRNDLETLRRAIPLWRTDWRCEPIGTQSCTYGISFWIPLSGTGNEKIDPYIFRSNMTAFTGVMINVPSKTEDYNLLRKLIAQWHKITPYYTGDYYPLSDYSIEPSAWMAWQFDRPDLGEGMVQAFRRPESDVIKMDFKLRGLDPKAKYTVFDMDAPEAKTMSGQQMMDLFTIELTAKPGSALIVYKKVK